MNHPASRSLIVTKARRHLRRASGTAALAAIAALIAACTSAPRPTPPAAPVPPVVPVAPPSPPPSLPPTVIVPPRPAPPVGPSASSAATARDYRRDAAGHLYQLNRQRIYAGRLPPLLYAVGVLQVDLDARGQVLATSWMRAPRHAPEVMAEIERTVRQAAPYPAPARLGKVTYTDTWLWHVSGKFQLDTLTEGQD